MAGEFIDHLNAAELAIGDTLLDDDLAVVGVVRSINPPSFTPHAEWPHRIEFVGTDRAVLVDAWDYVAVMREVR